MTIEMTQQIWTEFFTVALFHLLAVMSPGPDFAIVVKQSVNHGRKTGIITALGVGLAILIHVSYSLLGIGLLIKNSHWLFEIMKYLAATYLFYIGVKALKTKAQTANEIEEVVNNPIPSQRSAFWTGFLTNGLNPKATLFFFSLFAVVIDPKTPIWAQTGYGLYMSVATACWFIFVASLFGHKKVRLVFERMGHWFDRVMGAALIFLGIKIALIKTLLLPL